jgi:hypothetical protein
MALAYPRLFSTVRNGANEPWMERPARREAWVWQRGAVRMAPLVDADVVEAMPSASTGRA